MNPEIPPTEERPVEEETKRQFETMGDALRAGKDEGSAKAREAAPDLNLVLRRRFMILLTVSLTERFSLDPLLMNWFRRLLKVVWPKGLEPERPLPVKLARKPQKHFRRQPRKTLSNQLKRDQQSLKLFEQNFAILTLPQCNKSFVVACVLSTGFSFGKALLIF